MSDKKKMFRNYNIREFSILLQKKSIQISNPAFLLVCHRKMDQRWNLEREQSLWSKGTDHLANGLGDSGRF